MTMTIGSQAVRRSGGRELMRVVSVGWRQCRVQVCRREKSSNKPQSNGQVKQYLDAWMGTQVSTTMPLQPQSVADAATTTPPGAPPSTSSHPPPPPAPAHPIHATRTDQASDNTTTATTTSATNTAMSHTAGAESAAAPVVSLAGRSYLLPTLRLPVGVASEGLKDAVRGATGGGASGGYFRQAAVILDLSDWRVGLSPSNVSSSTSPPASSSSPPPAAAACIRSDHDHEAGAAVSALNGSEIGAEPLRWDAHTLAQCVAAVRSAGLRPIAVTNAPTEEARCAAMELGLPMVAGRSPPRSEAPKAPAEPRRSVPEAVLRTKVVEGSVRTGQQVIADPGCSLVVMGSVNSGGEVAADGDIHVYGKLAGRALAGLSGNRSARIFASRFNAELVGVADVFTTCDQPAELEGLVIDAPTTVWLDGKLRFQSCAQTS